MVRQFMDPLTRDVLKSPNYIGPLQSLKPYYRPLPKLHISQVKRADRACPVCLGINYGNGTIINHHSNGLFERERCPACHGTRIMPNVEARR